MKPDLTADERLALEMALFLRARGFNPIPSDPREKKPLYRFAADHGWETMFPAGWFAEEDWGTTNIQVPCGLRWRLIVIDLDGPGAKEVWEGWCRDRDCRPRTWTVHRDGGHSYHLWFRPPDWWDRPIRKRVAWKGDGKHEAIDVLGDRSLVVAPPSLHVETGGRYRFLEGLTPFTRGLSLPAFAPRWVMELPDVMAARKEPPAIVPARPVAPRRAAGDTRLTRDEILERLGDKVGLARSWGLRIAGNPGPTGWTPCHAFDREDRRASAAIHRDTGVYTDRGSGVTLSFFDLMTRLGQAHDFDDARDRLAEYL